MGFCPYFLQAQESEGGALSPFSLDPSTSLIGTDTTLFCMALLLIFGEEVEVDILPSVVLAEGGDSLPFSSALSWSLISELLNLPSMVLAVGYLLMC